jgi:hypothetical protein
MGAGVREWKGIAVLVGETGILCELHAVKIQRRLSRIILRNIKALRKFPVRAG